MDREKQIIDLVNRRDKESGGSCGTYFVELINLLQMSYDDFKTLIKAMHKEKKITFRKGINGFMVMKK